MRKIQNVLTYIVLGFFPIIWSHAEKLPELETDGSFEHGSRDWKQTPWQPRPATIIREHGNQYLQITVPKGEGNTIFASAKIPSTCRATKVRFRARCHINGEPNRGAIMVLFGSAKDAKGKPVKIQLSQKWRWYEVLVRFRASSENNLFKLTTVVSPLSVDIDDISFSAATAEESMPPKTNEPGLNE